ncbi:MAG: hypothetical protein ACSLFN_15255 [Candidatus Limnocylindrales bacterium]
MNRIRMAIGAIPLMVGLVAIAPIEVAATHLGNGLPDPTTVSISFVPSANARISDRVSARLVAYDDTPVSQVEIEFRREAEFLGPRRVLLGRATTDAAGIAQIPIRPTESRLRIEARFAGDERYAPAEATVDVEVPPGAAVGQGRAFEPPRSGVGLGQIASVMPLLIAGATVGVWVVLAGLVLVTLLGISGRRGNRSPGKGGQEAPS